MRNQVLLLALATCVLGAKLPSSSSHSESSDILSRTVSVKTPERVSNVISHFLPADHRYDASGSVLINRDLSEDNSPSTSTIISTANQSPVRAAPSKPRVATVANKQKSLSRTVSVKTPQRQSSVISHFTPADHRYDATGSVVINQGSSETAKLAAAQVNRASPPAKRPVQINIPARAAPVKVKAVPSKLRVSAPISTQKSLSRTVSVKTPQRQSSVISHFTPADHRYDATGSVVINQGSSDNVKISSAQSNRASLVQTPVRTAPVQVKAVPSQPRVSAPANTQKSLSRTVSVKTPQRQSGVISHFTPADHRYDATGSVVINQGSSGKAKFSSAQSIPTVSVQTPVKVAPVQVKSVPIKPRVSAPVNTQKSLSRTVSVKTPQRQSSVISHFTPADHRYDATGSVIINQGSSGNSKFSSAQSNRASLSQKRPAPVQAPVRTAPPPAPVKAAPSKLRVNAPVNAQKSLSRTVSVKTPQRQSSVISHFTPADHRYDATGSVVINQGSSGNAKFSASQSPRASPAPKSPVSVQAPVRSAPAAVKTVPSKPRVSAPVNTQKSLSRTVSVKTPQRQSSVISHFTPADHRYDATGSVVINQGSSGNAKFTASQSPRASPAPKRPVSIQAPVRSAPVPVKAVPSEPRVSAPVNTQKSLSRTVSVKTPQRQSSVISHFTPADHRYDATGSVVINQESSGNAKFTVSQSPRVSPALKRPASIQAPVRSAPAPVKAVPSKPRVSAPVNTQKSLSRTVSVKTPQRQSSVISHFTPADHRYDATGSVVINQGSSGNTKFTVAQSPRASPAPKRPASVQAPVRSAPAPVKPVPSKPRVSAPVNTQKSLSRTVSVKTPQRQSSVISHFTPADHRYDATGSVIINQGSSGKAKFSAAETTQASAAPKRPTVVQSSAPAPARVKVASSIPRVSAPVNAQKSLSRTVSVKTPQRQSSVISHFTPADHRYDATGSVVINQGSSGSAKFSTTQSNRASPAAKKPASIQSPVRAAQAPAKAVPSIPRVTSPVNTQKSLSRTVSVKTPQRQSGVISHFTPADHIYDATGSVVINQGSSGSAKLSVAQTKAAVPAPLRPVTVQAPVIRTPSKPRVTSSANTQKSLSRTVSVKTPQRQSSVISHFTPADHRYEATGNVVIAQGSSSSSKLSADRSSASANINPQPPTRSTPEVKVVQTPAAPSKQSVTSNAQKFLSRTVSVKTPERQSNIVSHFLPADHRYEATGSVDINQGSSAASTSSKFLSTSSTASSNTERTKSSSGPSSSFLFSQSASAGSQKQFESESQQKTVSKASSSATSSRSTTSSGSIRLAPVVKQASVSSLSSDLLAEMKAFRAEAAASGVEVPQVRQETVDNGEREEYYFNLCVEDHENTNYQCRDEWVGADGITRGWYTVLLPDAYLYNYTYIAHPVKGYQVSVTRRDSGIAMKQVEADIFAPATVFSNKGITRFSDFAVSGVNNRFVESTAMNFDQNSASVFANSFAEAMNTGRSASSGSVPAASSGQASHVNGFGFVRGSSSSGSSSGRIQASSSSASTSGISSFSSGASSQQFGSSQSSSKSSSGASSQRFDSTQSSSKSSSGASSQRFGSSQSSSKSSSASSAASAAVAASAVTAGSSKKSSLSSLSRTVSVKTPQRISGVISHFTPADHRYDATGSVVIDSSSQRSSNAKSSTVSKASIKTVTSTPVQASRIATPLPVARALSRTVSVKTPQRQSSVISHFTPRDHSYDATGSVVINQGSSGSAGINVVQPALPSNLKSVKAQPIVQSTPLKLTVTPSAAKSLSRTVSVKTPERQSSVISFFTPATHRYDATGSVVINSGSSGASKTLTARTPAPVVSSPASVPAPRKPIASVLSSNAKSISSSSGTQSSLSRTVSIKTPERVSGTIAHFTPAVNRYDATGSVVINHDNTASQAPRISTVRKISQAAPAPVSRRPVVKVQAAPAPSQSQSSLTRTVSVKTPERLSSVISHFTPAVNRYEATGSVAINKGSVSSAPRVSLPAASPAPLKAKSFDSTPASPAQSLPSSPSQLSLSRTVSVKTPERVSSVISHFTPAVNRYDATGSVTINRGSA